MKKEYLIRNDLAILNSDIKKEKVSYYNKIKIIDFTKNEFSYTNILFKNRENEQKELETVLIKQLNYYLKKYNIKNNHKAFIIGLGNSTIASDMLGVKTTKLIKATGYYDTLFNTNIRPIYTYIPGIIKDRGYMPFKGIKALKNELKPDFIIVIDSLLCSNIKYLNKVIQITDEGIIPGSGIWNFQEEISYKNLKIPVIVIGIPTVVEAITIIKDALKIKEQNITFEDGYDFLVTSKDIDILIDKFSKIISNSINKLLIKNKI